MAVTNVLAAAGQLGQQPSAPILGIPLDVTLDNSYPTGGYAFDAGALAQTFGRSNGAPLNVAVIAETKGGIVFEYDRTAKKLKAMWGAATGQPGTVLGNLSLTSAGLGIGSGSKAKVKIANTVTYLIAGVFKSKTTAETAFTTTTHDIAANASTVQERVYVVTLDTSGTVTLTAGTIATGASNAVIPAPPASQAVVGYVRIAVAAGATPFTAGTSLLDDGQLTVTYVNAAFLPAQQLSATPGALVEVTNATDLSAITARVTLVSN